MKDGFKFRGTFNPSCDDELNVEVKLPAQPRYLWVVLWILIVGEVYAPLLGVAANASPTEFVEHVSPAFGMGHCCFASSRQSVRQAHQSMLSLPCVER